MYYEYVRMCVPTCLQLDRAKTHLVSLESRIFNVECGRASCFCLSVQLFVQRCLQCLYLSQRIHELARVSSTLHFTVNTYLLLQLRLVLLSKLVR